MKHASVIRPYRLSLPLAIVVACAAGGATFGAVPTSMPVAAPYDLTEPQHVVNLMAALGSDDFTLRQAAQGDLDAVPFAQIDIVRRLAAQTSDLEIKARLDARIDVMEPEAALNPPPISLDVDKVSLSDLTTALAKATGTSVKLADRSNGAARFTLRVQNKPFWDVIDDLQQQNPIRVINTPGQPAASWDDLPLSALRGAASQSPDPATGVRLRLGVAYGGLGTPTLRLTIGVDPRIKCALSAKINSVKDDAGHEKNLQTLPDTGAQYYSWKWDEPPQANQRIKSLSVAGTLAITLSLHEERMVVDHPETHLNESIAVGGRYGKIAGFALSAAGADGKRTLKIAVGLGASPTPDRLTAGRIAAESPFVEDGVWFDVVDGTGKTLWTGNHSRMMELAYTSGTITTAIQEPVKVILRAPATKELTLPFEFKNLPLK